MIKWCENMHKEYKLSEYDDTNIELIVGKMLINQKITSRSTTHNIRIASW